MPTKEQAKPETLVMTGSLVAVTPTERIELPYGQELDQDLVERLGPGKMTSLRQTRSAIPKSEFDQGEKVWRNPLRGDAPADVSAEDATVEQTSSRKASKSQPPPKGQGAPVADWKQTPLAELKLPGETKDALAAAKLVTVEDALRYGAEQKTLTTIKGVDAATEKEIQQAIANVHPNA